MNYNINRIQRIAEELEYNGRFGKTRDFLQHGMTSVYEHSINVANFSFKIAEKCNLHISCIELIRGALLHDYFLYDWHIKDPAHRWHGFRHSAIALRNAQEDFELTNKEVDIIRNHMFPLTPIPPRTLEAWIVCIADKICSVKEILIPRLVRMKELFYK